MVPVPGGHIISLYPVVVPVLIAPLYLPAVGYLHLRGWTDARLDHVARVMEKLSASLVAALSASLLYLLLRRRAAAPIALLLTLAYAFGTTTWVISSQALWQHGMAELLVIGALLLLTGPCTAPRALAAGLLCGLIAGNRPPDAILAAALGAYGLFWAGRRAALLAAAAALPVGLVLLYNLGVAGNLAGGYGLMGKASFFQHDLLSGLGGLLFSPTRGLFVFSPFLLFLVLAWRHLPRDRGERGLTLAMSAGVVLQILLYAKADWRGGISWGPRYMTDLLPLLLWMLVPVVAALRGFGRACFLLAVGAAVAIEAIGAFWYTGATDTAIFAVASGPHQMRAAWDWRNAPFLASLQHGLAPAELTIEMRGSLDAIEAGGRATSAVTAGQEVVAAGWALAGHATPWQVAVVIDGRQTVASRTFFDRPDVRGDAARGEPRRLAHPARHGRPRSRRAPSDRLRLGLREGRGTLPGGAQADRADGTGGAADDADLDEGFRTAAARLREHQQAPGYWLTAYTSATRFQEPRPEMNTFLTALLVDLLDPLAATGGLGDSLQRARQHLTGQIEAGGLVRYHGLPGRSRHRHPGVRHHPGHRRHGARLEARSRPRPPAAAGRPGDHRPISHPRGPLPHLARAARGLPVPRSGQRSEPCRHRHPDAPAAAAGQGAAAGRPRALRQLSAPSSTRIGSGSTTEWRRWSRSCAWPTSGAPAASWSCPSHGCGRRCQARRSGCPSSGCWRARTRRPAGRRGGDPGGAAPACQGRLRSLAKESAAPLPQRSHRDGPPILLVGGRRLRALAKAL